LADCMWHSLALLSAGYTLGCVGGVTWGVLIGWFPKARYWGIPVLKLLGPIPATAFIPLSPTVTSSSQASRGRSSADSSRLAFANATTACWSRFAASTRASSATSDAGRAPIGTSRTAGATVFVSCAMPSRIAAIAEPWARARTTRAPAGASTSGASATTTGAAPTSATVRTRSATRAASAGEASCAITRPANGKTRAVIDGWNRLALIEWLAPAVEHTTAPALQPPPLPVRAPARL